MVASAAFLPVSLSPRRHFVIRAAALLLDMHLLGRSIKPSPPSRQPPSRDNAEDEPPHRLIEYMIDMTHCVAFSFRQPHHNSHHEPIADLVEERETGTSNDSALTDNLGLNGQSLKRKICRYTKTGRRNRLNSPKTNLKLSNGAVGKTKDPRTTHDTKRIRLSKIYTSREASFIYPLLQDFEVSGSRDKVLALLSLANNTRPWHPSRRLGPQLCNDEGESLWPFSRELILLHKNLDILTAVNMFTP
ncbi:hypothetical protein CC78DRAFT_610854 [Lojkania enalia]|uniref:Uncharacterized protein n=1 Tax=Lojkania enalia TaxID=147567 RepID=A0A9P4ND15_9PLEO|nr:hypothetical protein CC78DRAFT_610854 [Didymosphaeria enalia]